MTEAGKGAEEVQDILLKNVAMLHMIHNKKDERGKLTFE